jgi:hypothetical protein
MSPNPILEEIYAARQKLLADFDGDVHAYIEDARRRALASGHPIAAPSQRTGEHAVPPSSSRAKSNTDILVEPKT